MCSALEHSNKLLRHWSCSTTTVSVSFCYAQISNKTGREIYGPSNTIQKQLPNMTWDRQREETAARVKVGQIKEEFLLQVI